MTTEDNSKDVDNLQSVKVHEARLRKLLQFLKEKEALITVDHDPYGNSKSTKYSSGNQTSHSLKKFVLSIWPNTTDGAYYEYLKSNYSVSRKTTSKKKHHPSYERFIRDITCTFNENAHINRRKYKEQLFFSGHRPQQTNVLAAFPNFRQNIITELNQFVSLLRNHDKGFPYQQLRNHTAHRCHRYKQLEKNIFQNFKDTNPSALSRTQTNFGEVMSAFITHLEKLEAKGVGHEEPGDGRIIENRLCFKELSDPKNLEITPKQEQQLEKIGFINAFSDKTSWFDELRFKKIAYWNDMLEKLAISDWPEYFLEHILLAYVELNTVCSNIVSIRDQMFEEVGFYVKYSKDGQQIFTIEDILSHQQLSTLLSNYEYKSNAFVDSLRSDGNLLQEPIQQLPQNFDKVSSPDWLFNERIQKLLWEYLLFRMCESCQLSKQHVVDFDTPLYNPSN